jgi:hypothetical protein
LWLQTEICPFTGGDRLDSAAMIRNPGNEPLAHSDRDHRHPEVGEAISNRREHRHIHFELSEQDLSAIAGLDRAHRIGPHPDIFGSW